MSRIKTVIQTTSKTTAVTCNAYDAIIQTVPLTDIENGSFNFAVNNSYVQTISTILLTPIYNSLTEKSSIAVTLTGTSGTANIVVGGVNYLATFDTSLTVTCNNFVTAHGATLLALGITVSRTGAAVLTFIANTDTFPTFNVLNVTGDLAGTAAASSVVASTGNVVANIVSQTKGSFIVRIQNCSNVALNTFASIQFKLTHN